MPRKRTAVDVANETRLNPAAALIAKAKTASAVVPHPSKAAMNELRLLIEHNDTTSTQREKVGADAAINMLRSMGWIGRSRTTLDTLCKVALKRKSYGTP